MTRFKINESSRNFDMSICLASLGLNQLRKKYVKLEPDSELDFIIVSEKTLSVSSSHKYIFTFI
jgi:hypothetical protein